MIEICSDDALSAIEWEEVDISDNDHVARTFLQGERSMASLRGDGEIARTLDMFLGTVGDLPLLLCRGKHGEILLRADGGDQCVIVTGKTSEVLASYMERRPVSVQERMDMTLRQTRGRSGLL